MVTPHVPLEPVKCVVPVVRKHLHDKRDVLLGVWFKQHGRYHLYDYSLLYNKAYSPTSDRQGSTVRDHVSVCGAKGREKASTKLGGIKWMVFMFRKGGCPARFKIAMERLIASGEWDALSDAAKKWGPKRKSRKKAPIEKPSETAWYDL